MKGQFAMSLLLAFVATASAGQVNPLEQVLVMIDDLTAKITKEGEAEDKAYGEFFEWCDDTTKNIAFEIKTGTAKKEDLVAAIAKLTSDIEDADVKIAELVAALKKDSDELKKATGIREKEHADFVAEETELLDGIDTLDRAIGIIEKALAKNPGSFAQMDTNNLNGLLKAIGAMMDAAAVSSMSKNKLLAMVQRAKADSDDEQQDAGAPAAAVYESKAGGIVDVLEEMKDKAEEELEGLRSAEQASANNFAMLKQSLEDSMAADNKDLEDEKSGKAAASEDKATAEGELEVTTKALATAEKELTTTQNMCMQTATDHEESTKSRAEELKVIAEAKKIIQESTGGGAVDEAVSLFQVKVTKKGMIGREVIAMVKSLAKKSKSAALAQLASRIAATVKFGQANGEDPFEKIKGLIVDMIAKLEKEAKEDATEKAYCDEQMSKTEAKKSDLDDTIEKLTTKIDKSTAKSTELKEDVKVLQEELATIAKEQKELDRIRKEQHEAYSVAKEELTKGLAGVRKALEMLRKYYGGAAFLQADADMSSMMVQPKVPVHSKSGGAGGGIISMLEVCESDISKSLAATEKEEADQLEEYEATTEENTLATTEKTQDVKYKTQEFTGLDKSVADLSADLEVVQEEHAAVMKYYEKIKDRCIAKPISYEEIKRRRDAEIKGLQEALSILEGSFAQTGRHGRRHHFLGL